MIEVDIQGELPPGVFGAQILDLAEKLISTEAPGTNFEISLRCVESYEMRSLNHLYRGVDSNTDVLSFEGPEMSLGGARYRFCDIIIDTKQVFEQKGTNTYREEFWQVLIHALLHLVGYDHIRTSDRIKMEDAEDNYRKQIPEGLS